MSLYPIIWAAEHAPVRDAEERAILMALVIKGDYDGCNCFRSYKTLSKVARVDSKTAGRRCRELEARGILRRQTEHLSRAYLAIPKTQRPVVWEVMIPASFWSRVQLDEINEQREAQGREPITTQTRPDLPEAPPKTIRSDKGKKRPRTKPEPSAPGTDSPYPPDYQSLGDPGTDSPYPPDSQSPPQGLSVPQPSESPSESPSLSRHRSTGELAPSAADEAQTREMALPEGTPARSAGVPAPRQGQRQELLEMLLGLPGRDRMHAGEVAEMLLPLAVEAVAAGWTPRALRAHLARSCDPDRVYAPTAVYRSHLKKLPAAPAPAVDAGRPEGPAPECSKCSGSGFLEDPETFLPIGPCECRRRPPQLAVVS